MIDSQAGITDARREVVDFVPVFVGGVRLSTRKGSGLFYKDEAATCGITVAIQGGSVQQAALDRGKGSCPPDKPLTLKPFGGQAEAMNEVARGTAQAAFVERAVAAYAVQQQLDDYSLASPIPSGKGPNTQRNRVGLAFRKGEAAKVKAVGAAFDAVLKSGKYDALLKKRNLSEGDIRNAD